MAFPVRKLELVSLREQALSAIRAGIITGEIQPGEIHSAPVLAARLGVSATPVREAMLDLVKEGLVEPIRNRGFRITTVTDRDLDAILAIRMLLEVPTVIGATKKLRPKMLALLWQHVEDMEESARLGDLSSFLQADRQFHRGILESSGNDYLVDIVDKLRDQQRLYGLPQLAQAGRLIQTAREHRLILEAIEAGDGDEAERLMRRHLRHARGAWAGRAEDGDPVAPPA
jgi:DNA-binding GntR family transcriptional regulator